MIRPYLWVTFCGSMLLSSLSVAAGMSTHAYMADMGRKSLPEGPLKALLTLHRPSLIAGAIHPDGGYGSGAAFAEDRDMAEAAHWGDFTERYLDYLRDEKNNGRCAQEAKQYQRRFITEIPTAAVNAFAISEPCGKLIAFLFGNAAHGLTDESWDSLFEPQVRARGEDPNPLTILGTERGIAIGLTPRATMVAAIGQENYQQLVNVFASSPQNALEYAGDIVGIVEHFLWLDIPIIETPPTADLVEIYRNNRHLKAETVKPEAIERAHLIARSAIKAERAAAPIEITRIRETMPWLHGNYFTGPGGVVDSGYMVGGMYQAWWNRLIDANRQNDPAPTIVGHYPKNGQFSVPSRVTDPRFRLYAVMDRNLKPASVTATSVKLINEKGEVVPSKLSVGIYDRQHTHLIRIEPLANLLAKHTYTVVISPKVTDKLGIPLRKSFVWRFETE